VEIPLGERIALIDFVKTTPFREGVSKPYRRPPKRVILRDYDKLQSAHSAQVVNRLKDAEEGVGDIRQRLETFVGIVFVVFGLLLAALPLLSMDTRKVIVPAELALYFSLGLSVAAVILAVAARSPFAVKSAWRRIALFVATFLIIGGALGIGVNVSSKVAALRATYEDDLKQLRISTKEMVIDLEQRVEGLQQQLATKSSPDAR
jgi:hypothetical protein